MSAPKKAERFDKLYTNLNPEQKRAVDAIDGPVMVIAGPGTGKTTILTLRIANILHLTDTPPSGILAITFTDAGVKAMRMKLREVIGSRADEVRIHTFHGFAASMLEEFSEHVPHLYRAKQITDIEAEDLVREILRDPHLKKIRPTGEPDYYIRSVLSTVSEAKREAWTPDVVRAYAKEEVKRIKNDADSISSRGATKGELKAEAKKRIEKAERTLLFADVYEAYEAKKQKDKKIDFDDLIAELLLALRSDELLLRLIQEKFLYILVDEHQDTNDSQNLLVRTIADFFENPNLFVVGDEKQAIYRFQGASVANFLKFEKTWQSMQVISLKDNYRSHQAILDSSFALIEHNYTDGEHENLRVQLRSGRDEVARPIELIYAGNTAAADKALIERLKAFSDAGGGQTAAVIVRRNRDLERIATLCEAHGIVASSERGVNIFEHPIGSLFFELLNFLADPSQVESLAVTFAGGLWHLPLTESGSLIRLAKSGKLNEVVDQVPVIGDLTRELIERGSLSYLVYAAEKSGLLEMAIRSPLGAEVWHSVMALATELASRGSLADNPRALITALLAHKVAAESRSVKVLSGAPDSAIRIMTAHGSKGLEYDEVFIPYAIEETWMPRPKSPAFVLPREKVEGDEIRDGRRLFYVAMTRARRHLTILVPLEDVGGRLLTPVRFLTELPDKAISRVEIPRAVDEIGVLAKSRGQDQRAKALADFAKVTLLEKGLSVTALNHFLECPQKFLYKSILKVPEPPSATSEKGNAMHEALARVWHLANKSEKKIAAEIGSAVESYFTSSLLPSYEKANILSELLEATPVVAKALTPHFALATTGEVATESWIETIFTGKYNNSLVQFPLHGKLDAIIVQADKVLVFDYKTREAMSVAAIRGETKTSSSGEYFRQLVFYRILLYSQSRFKGKDIEPALIFVKPDAKGRCPEISLPIVESDLEKVKREISTLVESVWSGKIAEKQCPDEECVWCRLSRLSK